MERIKLNIIIFLLRMLLCSIPAKYIFLFSAGSIFALLSIFTFVSLTVSEKAVRDALRERTQLDEDNIKLWANLYSMPYAAFWIFIPQKWIRALIEKIRGRKND